MTSFIDAIQFLTIFRFRNDRSSCTASSAAYFPLVGAFLGVILIVLNEILTKAFPEPFVNLILVIVSATLTGALHLDGLADTCDAFFSGKSRDDKLLIMRDPHKGTFGTLGLIVIILLKINLLLLVPVSFKDTAIFLMMVFSRYSMNIGIKFFPYARGEGKANIFFEKRSTNNFLFASLIMLILTGITFNLLSPIILFLAVVFTFIIDLLIKRIIGGLTGDTLGAACELNEIAILLFMIILLKFFI
ncbi:MAG: adenosylcobinamide-GDP ribazoletransferase [Candidatus Omnitrophota bacterium]|nr:adenosylcobinamide-GDP ribazoletransferase [Candidatus Omnitrophota bacterium]